MKVQLDQEQNQSKRSTTTRTTTTTTTSTTTTTARTTTTTRTTTTRRATFRPARTTQSRFKAKMEEYHNQPTGQMCGQSPTLNRLTSDRLIFEKILIYNLVYN